MVAVGNGASLHVLEEMSVRIYFVLWSLRGLLIPSSRESQLWWDWGLGRPQDSGAAAFTPVSPPSLLHPWGEDPASSRKLSTERERNVTPSGEIEF